MALTSISTLKYPPLPSMVKKESWQVVKRFQSLMKTDQSFREKIETSLSENYLGIVCEDKILKCPVWITPTQECYPIFFDRMLAKSNKNNKLWVWAVDVVNEQLFALSRSRETHPPTEYPKPWNEYLLITENQFGPECFGFYANRELLPDGSMLSTSYFLQTKYDQNLCHFINMQWEKNRGDERQLRTLANYLTAQMIFEVAALHAQNIVHRDIKLDNFLTRETESDVAELKLTDMEFSRAPGVSEDTPGRKEYFSPQYAAELKQQSSFTVSFLNDAWALGITILKMEAHFGFGHEYDFVMDTQLENQVTINKIYALLDDPNWISECEPEDPFEKIKWRFLRVHEAERWTVSQGADYILQSFS